MQEAGMSLNTDDANHISKRSKRSASRMRGIMRPIVIALLFLTGLTFWMLRTGDQNRVVQFANGSIITVKGVVYGQLKAPLQNKNYLESLCCGPPQPLRKGMSIWLSIDKTAPVPFPELYAFDAHGDMFSSTYSWNVIDPLPARLFHISLPFLHTTFLYRFDFANFPRRDKIIRIKMTDGVGNMIGDFTVVNPAQISPPALVPDPLPITRSAGDLGVTLKRVSWGRESLTTKTGDLVDPPLVVDYEIQTHSQTGSTEKSRAEEWTYGGQELEDATGNVSPDGSAECKHESAYRLRLMFERVLSATFTPEETWTIKDLPVPAPGKNRILPGTFDLAGVRFSTLAISAAPHAVQATGRTAPPATGATPPTVPGNALQVAVTADGLRSDQRLVVWATATDAQGHTLRYNENEDTGPDPPDVASNSQKGSGHLELRSISLPLTARKVDLRFSIYTVRTVEFIVHPDDRLTRGKSQIQSPK